MSEIPSELKYARTHEWARLEEDGTVTVRYRDTMEQHRVVAFVDADAGGCDAGGLAAEPAALLHLLRTAMMSGA